MQLINANRPLIIQLLKDISLRTAISATICAAVINECIRQADTLTLRER